MCTHSLAFVIYTFFPLQTGFSTFLDTMRTAVKGYQGYLEELEANKKKQQKQQQKQEPKS